MYAYRQSCVKITNSICEKCSALAEMGNSRHGPKIGGLCPFGGEAWSPSNTMLPGPRPWAPARGEQGGQPPTLVKMRVSHAHPGNINHGLKSFRQ